MYTRVIGLLFVVCSTVLFSHEISPRFQRSLLQAYADVIEGETSLELYTPDGFALSAWDVACFTQSENNRKYHDALAYLRTIEPCSLGDTIKAVSAYFLGTPFSEVSSLFYDWDRKGFNPCCMRVDTFDSLSFLELVLAMSSVKYEVAQDVTGAMGRLFEVQAKELIVARLGELMFSRFHPASAMAGMPSVLTRHCFLDGEWVEHNRALIKSVTNEMYRPHPDERAAVGDDTKRSAPYTAKHLTKQGVLQKKVQSIAQRMVDEEKRTSFKQFYKERIKDLGMIASIVSYIPLENIIDDYEYYAELIEEPMIMVVVADKPKLREEKGSHFNTTTFGFVFAQNEGVTFRYVDAESKEVCDVDMCLYAKECLEKRRLFNKALGFGFLALSQ